MTRAAKNSSLAWQGFVLITSVIIAILSLRILILGMEAGYPNLMHHFPDRVMLFWSQVISASLTLLIMPFQFWKGLRVRRPVVHRRLGRVYAFLIWLAVSLGRCSRPMP